MSIKFECPKCNKQLEAENDHSGMMLECPQCKEEVKVPKPSLKVANLDSPPPINKEEAPKDKKKNPTPKQWLQGCLTFIILTAIIGGCMSTCGQNDGSETKKDEEAKKTEIEKVAKLTPEDRLNYILKKELGKLNRKGERVSKITLNNNVIHIEFSINDNLSKSWIKDGMNRDIVKILNCIRTSKFNKYLEVMIQGYFPLVDKYGASKEQMVFNIVFFKKDIDRINFDKFYGDRVYHLGNKIWIHPAFKYSK